MGSESGRERTFEVLDRRRRLLDAVMFDCLVQPVTWWVWVPLVGLISLRRKND